MKKFLLSLLMMPVLAQAGVGIAEDVVSSCYLFKQNKLTWQGVCNYDFITGVNYDEPNKNEHTNYESRSVMFGNGTKIFVWNGIIGRYKDDGELISQRQETKIDDRPAVMIYRDLRTKIQLGVHTAKKRMDRTKKQNKPSTVLTCFQAKDKSVELCLSLNEG